MRFDIGSEVTFLHRGTTQTGRIVGVELVSEPRRRCGWHYVIRTSEGEWLCVHESQIGGVVGEVAVVS